MSINELFKERLDEAHYETREDFIKDIEIIADDIVEDVYKWVRATKYSEKNIDETIEDMECTCDEMDEELSYKGRIAKFSEDTYEVDL